MSFVSTIMGTAERVPLPDTIIRAAIHQLCSRTATRLATGNAESDAWLADEMAARALAEYSDEPDVRGHAEPAEFFARCSVRTANIPRASTRSRPLHCRRPRRKRCDRR